MARDFEPYEGHYHYREDDKCCDNCCTSCIKNVCKNLTKQLWKLLIFIIIYAICGFGIYWGINEVISLNNFSEVSNGCTIISINSPLTGEDCNECNCNYYYNPFEFDKKRVCNSCDSVKYNYTVISDHCGSQLLTLDDDYWNDKACGIPLKNIGEKYTCYLYADCRGKYSFDTMYADQEELVYPIIIISISAVLMILTCLIRCICC